MCDTVSRGSSGLGKAAGSVATGNTNPKHSSRCLAPSPEDGARAIYTTAHTDMGALRVFSGEGLASPVREPSLLLLSIHG